jgi:hypothetical protein
VASESQGEKGTNGGRRSRGPAGRAHVPGFREANRRPFGAGGENEISPGLTASPLTWLQLYRLHSYMLHAMGHGPWAMRSVYFMLYTWNMVTCPRGHFVLHKACTWVATLGTGRLPSPLGDGDESI